MKQAILMTLILVAIGWMIFFPKPEDIVSMDQGAVKLSYFEVDLKGEVNIPSKRHFFAPVTLGEVIDMCGGLSQDADISRLNFSELITSNRQITIDRIQAQGNLPAILVNINQASFKELLTIPGMTETKAASLIIYREAHGHFKHVDELIHVKHIGPATLEKIKPFIKL
jgi:competence protein ComEA